MFSSNTSQVEGGYQISRSLRFNSADSAYLNRTPASAGNRTTWTFSGWAKLSALGTSRVLFSAITGSNETTLYFDGSNRIDFYDYASSAYTGRLQTTQVFRDPSAWYHIVAVWDSGNATAGDRMRLYINGSEVTVFNIDTNPAQNTNSVWNQAIEHRLGGYSLSSIPWDGYMTEVNFIDGQALTPSSFGETNAQTGVWQPKAYAGSYGTNGFYLNFSDNSNTTSTTLGKDYSGNGNNWAPNNFSVAAGVGNDSLVDTPTPYGSDSGAGGEVRGNYCTLNPLSVKGATLSNGNLDVDTGTTNGNYALGTIAFPSSGKWYFEYTPTANGNQSFCGVADSQNPGSVNCSYYAGSGEKYVNGAASSYGTSYGNNDVIGVAVNVDSGTVTFYVNNSSQGAITYATSSGSYVAFFADGTGATGTTLNTNFGQRPFAYTAPSGFKALCTQNLPTPTIGATTATQAGKYFNPVLYTGNGNTTAQAITGVGFQPDWTWIKARSASYVNLLFDAVRGSGKQLISELTNAESTVANFVSFDSDGFTVNADGGASSYNANGSTYVAWNWKANGSGSSNTAGSITSTVSANTTSGFSIATWTGTGSGTATIGHGLGVAPSMIIVKFRDTTSNWSIYHASLGNTKRLTFTTAAEETDANIWNNTSPTTTVFTTGTTLNQSFTYVAYCFAAVAGYSAFGSFVGNGSSDGPFVFTGFRPKLIMIKRTDAASSWVMLDTVRNTYNVMDKTLWTNLSDAEGTYTILDSLSNGFKLRDATNGYNTSSGTYIYAAFAEFPQKFSLAR